MAKKSFVKGAVILGIAGVIIKVMGAIFRIPLANIIGDDGMAYYQAAYPVYTFLLMVSTAGIPTAISRMVSERRAMDQHYEAYRVFKLSFKLLAIIGGVSFAICFFLAGPISEVIQIPESKLALMTIAPALFFCPLMSAFRGYFQGQQDMTPTATSQVVEQLFRVVVGLTLAIVLLKIGKEWAAAGAAFGATAGSVGGLLAILFLYMRRRAKLNADVEASRGEPAESNSSILKKILIIAVPVTIGSAIMPIMNFIDVGMVVRRLTATGWEAATAKSLYGQLSGFVAPLINFPQVLTQSLAMSLVPAIASAHRQNDMPFLRENVSTAMRFATIIGFPCAAGFMVMAKPILLLLYPAQKASALNSVPCLMIMGFGVIFLSTVQTLTGVLQGLGKQMIPVRNLAIGALAKIAVTYVCTGIHAINVNGAALGTITAYILASTLNMIAVRKYTGVQIDIKLTYLKPAISVLVMAACTKVAYMILAKVFGNAISCLGAIAVAVVVYVFMIFITRSITIEEVRKMPKGARLAKILEKFVKNR